MPYNIISYRYPAEDAGISIGDCAPRPGYPVGKPETRGIPLIIILTVRYFYHIIWPSRLGSYSVESPLHARGPRVSISGVGIPKGGEF